MTLAFDLPRVTEQVQREVREIDVKRVLLILVIAIPVAIGWTAAKTVLAARFLGAAIREGYREGIKPRGSD